MTIIKRVICLLVILTLIVSAAGCYAMRPASNPNSLDDGQQEPGLAGGDASLDSEINLNDIVLSGQESNTVVELSFISGSRLSEVPESKIATVPQYSISVLPAPYRLKIDLHIDYTDYDQKSDPRSEGLVSGVFQENGTEEGVISVYFQLTGNTTVSVQTEEAKLSVVLSTVGAEVEEAHFVGLDAFTEAADIPEALGLQPTLCEGLEDAILISPPMDSPEEAEEYQAQVNDAIKETIPDKQAYTFSMSTDALPQLLRQEEDDDAEAPVFETPNEPVVLELLIRNGKYLCTAPNGDIVYSRAYLPESGQDDEYVLKEELWSMDAKEKSSELGLKNFYGIEDAGFSPSGRYLAILDASVIDKLLYIYDMETKELYNLGEEGFGNNTTSFVWDDTADVIYAMTGYGALQLTKYDFSKPMEERISSVEEKNGAESKIALAGGKLYFVDRSAGDAGEIYGVDLETGERMIAAQGMDFVLSGDGRYLAALSTVPGDQETMLFNVELIDLSGETPPVMLAENVMLEEGDYAFGAEPDTFYYTTTTYEGVSGEYPFAFLKYSIPDGETEFQGYFKTGKFAPGQKPGETYVIDYFLQNNDNFYATYIYREEQT